MENELTTRGNVKTQSRTTQVTIDEWPINGHYLWLWARPRGTTTFRTIPRVPGSYTLTSAVEKCERSLPAIAANGRR